ncbi:MAG: hypothetical protein RL117_937 [Verrucomicrobiota bacterium]|jgi:hypothetical protein
MAPLPGCCFFWGMWSVVEPDGRYHRKRETGILHPEGMPDMVHVAFLPIG